MFSQGVGSQHQPNPQPLNLFGSQRTTNLFGPQQPTNLFGNQQSTSLFGHQQSTNNLFGTQQSNPQTIQQLPLVAQPATGIPYPKDTKFSDLNDSMRNSLETVEKSLRTLFDLSAALSAREYNHTESLAERISSISKRVSACEATNEACRSQLASAKRIMNGYWRYGETVARAVVACKPQLTPMASKTTMDSTTAPFIAPSIQTVELLEEIVSRMELQATDLVDAAKVSILFKNQNKPSLIMFDLYIYSILYRIDLFKLFKNDGLVAVLEILAFHQTCFVRTIC